MLGCLAINHRKFRDAVVHLSEENNIIRGGLRWDDGLTRRSQIGLLYTSQESHI